MSISAVQIRAPGKVNLYLELNSKRSDGFHELETVIVSLGLHDELAISRREDGAIHLTCQGTATSDFKQISSGPDNLVFKTIELVRERFSIESGFNVKLFKRIPPQAGLGGGSSDAAATLMGLNQLEGLNLNQDQLVELGSQLGSDIPFFLVASPARCTGRGEHVERCSGISRFWMVVAKPPQGLSTPEVFRNSQVPDSPCPGDSMLHSLRLGCARKIAKSMFNRLQQAAEDLCPWIGRLKDEFSRTGCFGHQMTGSGSSYFGIYSGKITARRALGQLRSRLPQVAFFCTQAYGGRAGPKLMGTVYDAR